MRISAVKLSTSSIAASVVEFKTDADCGRALYGRQLWFSIGDDLPEWLQERRWCAMEPEF